MKRVQFIRLRHFEGTSQKIYEAELCELPGLDHHDRFVVNFRYGLLGGKLREGSKTSSPVSLEKGHRLFNSVIVAKINEGYRPADTETKTSAVDISVGTNKKQTEQIGTIQSRILSYLDTPPAHWPLSRIIWRAGELRIQKAADKITKLIGSRDVKMDYSIAWALGRCGRESHTEALEPLLSSQSPAVRRIALEAFFAIAPSRQVSEQLDRARDVLPAELQRSIEREDHQEVIKRLLATLSAHDNKSHEELLENLYTVALRSKPAHRAILHVLRVLPFQQQHYFRAFRHILKRSEFRLDSEVFAAIALRIEQTTSLNRSQMFNSATRDYLRRRVWRTLRKLGEASDSKYVSMAAALLATVTDGHGKEPLEIFRTRYSWQNHRYEKVSVIKADRFSRFLAFNHILYANSEQYALSPSRKFWQKVGEATDPGRTEAFSELWDSQPDTVLTLLQNSYCNVVHSFCVKILQDNEQFCYHIPLEVVFRLLCSVYEVTAKFALEIATKRYDPQKPDPALLAACLEASYAPARELGMQWLDQQISLLREYPDICITALLTPFSDLREWIVVQVQRLELSDSEQRILIEQIIERTVLLSNEGSRNQLPAVIKLILAYFKNGLSQIQISHIGRLLEDERVDIQLFGAKLLLHLDVRGETLPDSYLSRINTSPDTEIRSIGVSLLGKFDDSFLLERQQLLISFCFADEAFIRQAVQPIVRRLAIGNAMFAETLSQQLIQSLFVTETAEGLHDDSLRLLTDALVEELRAMDSNLRWRLIHARSKAAQRLGAISLQYVGYSTYSVRQWAAFANCQEKNVRTWAMAAYEAEPETIRAEAVDALRILNSRWDDSREFGVNYFRKYFSEDDWNPEMIVGVCDNVRDDIQRFGRELITEFFREGDGLEYLNTLSQHPSRNVQLFTTNFLFSYAKNDTEKLTRLKSFFLTVLSQVRKGRVAKDRVMTFLTEEALRSKEAAQFVGDIFNRQSVTCSIQDRAGYIEAMCAIRQVYPDIEMSLMVNGLPIKEHGRKEVKNAI
jgi:hypothetical protein